MILKDESLSLDFYCTFGAGCAQGRFRTFVIFLIGRLCFRMGNTLALLKEKRMNGKVMAALFGIAILSGCASSKTSPERHAFYFVSHQSSFTGGNYTSSVQKNYQLNVAQFRELYARGKADRAEGRTEAEASEYAQSIRDQLKENATSQELFARRINGHRTWTVKTPYYLATNWPRLILMAITAYNSATDSGDTVITGIPAVFERKE